jgi:uncharacterized protein YfiM (DUF2279 family)
LSTIRVDNFGPSAGGTTYSARGIAKAWVNFNGQGTIAARDSENVSSLTDNATGEYTINLSNAFGAGDYSASGMASNGSQNVSNAQPSAGSFSFTVYIASSGTKYDSTITLVSCHGDLA